MKNILFVTGTRADYGKLKSLMRKVEQSKEFKLSIFVTGMHMLSRYGSTWNEIEKDGFKNIYKYINQNIHTTMDIALSNTVIGLSNYVLENKPDMIVVHGDRLEALAGAIVGAFNNIKVAHIEGGEVSGTIDESIRHAITKLAHIHLVSNEESKKRIIQLGENEKSIFVIGSPDIDIMNSKNLPSITQVKKRYNIPYNKYGILIYHPITTEVEKITQNIKTIVDALIKTEINYIIIYPNNDLGSEIIINEYKRLEKRSNFKVYPSLRFEYFLTLLKHAEFIIGNSSAGIREVGVYGVPSIDLGNRQKGRYLPNNYIIHTSENVKGILKAIIEVEKIKDKKINLSLYGYGHSDEKFIEILKKPFIWEMSLQKRFTDISIL